MPVAIETSLSGISKQRIFRCCESVDFTNGGAVNTAVSEMLKCDKYCVAHGFYYDPTGDMITLFYNPYIHKRGFLTINKLATKISGRTIHGAAVLLSAGETKEFLNANW